MIELVKIKLVKDSPDGHPKGLILRISQPIADAWIKGGYAVRDEVKKPKKK